MADKSESSNVSYVLTKKDADKFAVQAKKYATTVTASKKKAQKTLVSLGIHTPTGRLSKRYG